MFTIQVQHYSSCNFLASNCHAVSISGWFPGVLLSARTVAVFNISPRWLLCRPVLQLLRPRLYPACSPWCPVLKFYWTLFCGLCRNVYRVVSANSVLVLRKWFSHSHPLLCFTFSSLSGCNFLFLFLVRVYLLLHKLVLIIQCIT